MKRLQMNVVPNLRQAEKALLALVALFMLASVAMAQSGSSAGYGLTWWTVDGGGYTFSTGGSYALGGTAGQPDAGPALTNGGYALAGGFWGVGAAYNRLHLPLVLRQFP